MLWGRRASHKAAEAAVAASVVVAVRVVATSGADVVVTFEGGVVAVTSEVAGEEEGEELVWRAEGADGVEGDVFEDGAGEAAER